MNPFVSIAFSWNVVVVVAAVLLTRSLPEKSLSTVWKRSLLVVFFATIGLFVYFTFLGITSGKEHTIAAWYTLGLFQLPAISVAVIAYLRSRKRVHSQKR